MKIGIRRTGKLSSGERRLLATCVLAIAGFAACGWLKRLHDLPPALPAPQQHFPIPNGYDTLQTAYNCYVSMPTPAVDEVGETRQNRKTNGRSIERNYPSAPREAWLKSNATALGLVHVALAQKFLQRPTPGPTELNALTLAKLLVVEAHARVVRGDWPGVVDVGLDLCTLGAKVPAGAALDGPVLGGVIEARGIQLVWAAMPHLSAAQTKNGLVRLEVIETERVPVRFSMQEEEAILRRHLLTALRANPMDGSRVLGGDQSVATWLSWKFANYRTIMADYDMYWGKSALAADAPYRAAKITPPGCSLSDPVTCQLTYFSDTLFYCACDKARESLLATTMALRVFQNEHGRYPAALSELVPATLKNIPIDYLGSGGPLLYHRRGAGYILYSVGPDGRDDGGRAIHFPGRDSNRYYVRESDTGDIVAGINR